MPVRGLGYKKRWSSSPRAENVSVNHDPLLACHKKCNGPKSARNYPNSNATYWRSLNFQKFIFLIFFRTTLTSTHLLPQLKGWRPNTIIMECRCKLYLCYIIVYTKLYHKCVDDSHRCLHSTCFRISNISLPISNNIFFLPFTEGVPWVHFWLPASIGETNR